MTKHVRKAGKVDPGDMVTLPVKITCESELTLLNPLARVTLSPCKQDFCALSLSVFQSVCHFAFLFLNFALVLISIATSILRSINFFYTL